MTQVLSKEARKGWTLNRKERETPERKYGDSSFLSGFSLLLSIPLISRLQVSIVRVTAAIGLLDETSLRGLNMRCHLLIHESKSVFLLYILCFFR